MQITFSTSHLVKTLMFISFLANAFVQAGNAAEVSKSPIPTKDAKKDEAPAAAPKPVVSEEANRDPSTDAGREHAAGLKSLAFMQGVWEGRTTSGAYVEEAWSAPQGDSLVGYCRFIKESRTTFYELLAVVKLADTTVLRMKHLNADFVPWADKDEAGDLKLISSSDSEATFDNGNKNHHVKVVYKKTGAKSLHVDVEDTTDGKTNSFPFDYKLKE